MGSPCARACQVAHVPGKAVSFLALLLFALPPPSLPAQFPDVTSVDSETYRGITYLAGERLRNTGRSLAFAGDVNKDGAPDLLIGADGNGQFPGRVFVTLGNQRGPLRRELPGMLGGGIFEFRSGSTVPDRFGFFVAGAGDADGDGIDDFLIGAPGDGNPNLPQGGVFLVFGAEHFPGMVDLVMDPTRALLLTPTDGRGTLGLAGAGVGDVNADGFADIALGMPHGLTAHEGGPLRPTGKVLVVFGGTGLRGGPRILHLDSLEPPVGFEIPGFEEESELGFSVAPAGDLDGDGIQDFALGAPRLRLNGSAFVIFGKRGLAAAPDLAVPDGAAAVELRSALALARLGDALAGGSDATGDGQADLLLGAPETERDGGGLAGAAVLVPGGAGIRGTGVVNIPGPAGMTFRGLRGSSAGAALAFVPDANGDGISEILIGAPNLGAGRGEAYLIYDGLAPGGTVFLEELSPPRGATFRASLGGARLGRAVAGLPDRNGDRIGDFALGASGFPSHGVPGSGAVFEVTQLSDPESPAPRNLRATAVPGGKVVLTWTIPHPYRFLRVYRDGSPIDGSLPGDYQVFIDVAPGPGTHVYFVEADGDERLRSNLAEVHMRPLPVRELTCRQVVGSLRVSVTWVLGDTYRGLVVLVDGRPAANLPPHATSFELDVASGDHRIEVFDPISVPEGEHGEPCYVRVNLPELPAIQGFTCSLEPPMAVHLRWQPSPAYSTYQLIRNGRQAAKITDASEYFDDAVPSGVQRYELFGINDNLHPGPRAVCEVIVPSQGSLFLRGRVAWAGEGSARGAVGAGRIFVVDGTGKPLSEVQVTESGQFVASVERAASYRVTFKARLDRATLPSIASPPEDRGVVVTVVAASIGDEVLIEVPPPVFLVSSLGAETPEQGPAARWRTLRGEMGLGPSLLHFPMALPPGIARGARFLDSGVREVKAYLAGELGSAPRSVDIIAYGSAGLSARAYLAGAQGHPVRRMALLGTPNLGTARGHLEARAELAGGGDSPSHGEFVFSGATEQTEEFLAELNRRIHLTRGAEIHLIAGTAGHDVLDPILECGTHDDRVCEASALGGVPGAHPHRVEENHETLGRGAASLALLKAIILAPAGGGGEAPAAGAAGGGAGAGAGAGADAGAGTDAGDAGGDPGSGGAESSHPPGDVYSGVLEAGDTGIFPLISDTSESIIIILNSELPGGIGFSIITPSGQMVDPPAAGALDDVDYQTYGDGEGHEVQAYKFEPCVVGTYLAQLDNPVDNAPIEYTLEVYIESGLVLEAIVEPGEIDLGQNAVVLAALTRNGAPETGAAAEARVWRPKGDLEILSLLDDGIGADSFAGDGIYSAAVVARSQPGIHEVEASAVGTAGLVTLYRREATSRLQVRSDVVEFGDGAGGGGFASGSENDDGDEVLDSLYIEGIVTSRAPGIFLVIGKLTDLAGSSVAEGGTIFSLSAPETAGFRVYFDGSGIYAAHRNGPFVLSEIVLLDGNAGFVEADRLEKAHTTSGFEWTAFGAAPGRQYVRGDTNADGNVDISDGVAILEFLFTGTKSIACRDAANANDDGDVNVSDTIYLLSYLFGGGAPVPAPYPSCGAADRLGCDDFPACP